MSTPHRRPIWRARAVCPRGHLILERLFDPNRDGVHDALYALEDETARVCGGEPWCPVCGAPAEQIVYEAGPTRFYSMSAAVGALTPATN